MSPPLGRPWFNAIKARMPMSHKLKCSKRLSLRTRKSATALALCQCYWERNDEPENERTNLGIDGRIGDRSNEPEDEQTNEFGDERTSMRTSAWRPGFGRGDTIRRLVGPNLKAPSGCSSLAYASSSRSCLVSPVTLFRVRIATFFWAVAPYCCASQCMLCMFQCPSLRLRCSAQRGHPSTASVQRILHRRCWENWGTVEWKIPYPVDIASQVLSWLLTPVQDRI